jgi:hypothetical protein
MRMASLFQEPDLIEAQIARNQCLSMIPFPPSPLPKVLTKLEEVEMKECRTHH